MTKPYLPIDCDEHEKLEFAVLRDLPLGLHLKGGRSVHGHARDVYTRDGAEWLKFFSRDEGEMTIRLDEIASIEEPPTH